MSDVIEIRVDASQEGTASVLQKWLKQPGEFVSAHEPVAELQTDKVVVEVAAPADGIVAEVLVAEGDEVNPGDVLARLQPGVAVASELAELAGEFADSVQPATEEDREDEDTSGRVKLSPVVRRLVKHHGLDPEQIAGSGRGGRITVRDIQAYLQKTGAAPQAAPGEAEEFGTVEEIVLETEPDTDAELELESSSATEAQLEPEGIEWQAPEPERVEPGVQPEPVPREPDTAVLPVVTDVVTPQGTPAESVVETGEIPAQLVPHTQMRKRIADHMVQSLLHTSPHVTTVFETDMSAVLRHYRQHKPLYAQRGVKLTLTAYFVSACVEAMHAVPEVNARYHDDHLEIFEDINIGVATALGNEGLVVPVLRRVQQQNLFGIASRLVELTEAARDGELSPADVQNGTFTISNHGVGGSLVAAPIIINQPQVAILGVGKLQKRVIVAEIDGQDSMQIRPMCYITLSLDHRALDAFQANGFLSRLVEVLENWP